MNGVPPQCEFSHIFFLNGGFPKEQTCFRRILIPNPPIKQLIPEKQTREWMMLDIVMCCLSRELCWSSELIIDILEKHIVVIYTENPPVKTSTDCIREELWRKKRKWISWPGQWFSSPQCLFFLLQVKYWKMCRKHSAFYDILHTKFIVN